MKNEFIQHVENEVKNYKLYKLQNIDKIKREYNRLKDFIKVDRFIHVSKNIWIIMLFILIIVISLSALYFLFNTSYLQSISQNINGLLKILLFVIFLFSFIMLYLFYDKIHKNNSLYKLDKLFTDYFKLLENIEHEEKIKYETFMDYLIETDKK